LILFAKNFKKKIKQNELMRITSVFPTVHVREVVVGIAHALLLVANGVLPKSLRALDALLTWRFEALGHLEAANYFW
jgi:hypothetical protein